ncbi:MAG TPA: glycoside hydrolase family 3 C-terminal domain-containing protein, partial [Bacteroidales bacterium]
EKITMIHGNTMFSSGGVPRLGIPDLTYSDGPHGVRAEVSKDNWQPAGWKNDSSSYLPALSALASTWNVDLAREYGVVLGSECKARGKNVSLAPGVNIHRVPLNGRNWEYMSEDPFLASRMAVQYIKGVQSKGVASCVKHFALNNQEFQRNSINVEIDERVLREIYLPAFEAAVKEGGVLSVMGAYNKIRGFWCCENTYLLNDILRKDWSFKGIVVSDWNAVHNTQLTAKSSLDVEMGTKPPFDQYYMANPMLEAVKKGEVSEEAINEKVRHILYVMIKLDLLNKPKYNDSDVEKELATPEHSATALKIAEEAIVLLKNKEQKLPLDAGKIKSIAVIGGNADYKFSLGGGSTTVKAKYEITPLQGLKNYLGDKVKIDYASGYNIAKGNQDVFDANLFSKAVALAKDADLVLYIGGLNHERGGDTEGSDKVSMKLPYKQDSLLNAICQVNPNIVVTLMTGGPVELGDWYNKVPALIQTSFIGMEGGNALARAIFGDVNPSGKLTDSWPKKLEDSPAIKLGEYTGSNGTEHYNEGLMVGYRYFDTKHVEPMFHFGYGLSYTQFEYSALQMPETWNDKDSLFTVSFTVTNNGKREGKETAQLYLHEQKCSVERPYKELKGFSKVSLKPGESKMVSITLNKRALQYYDVNSKSWKDEAGKFEVLVGASSNDIRLKKKFTLAK